MNYKIKVGKNIKALRIAKKLTQEKLAELSKVDRTYIQSIEAGRRNFSIEVLIKISKSLDVSPTDILKGIKNGF